MDSGSNCHRQHVLCAFNTPGTRNARVSTSFIFTTALEVAIGLYFCLAGKEWSYYLFITSSMPDAWLNVLHVLSHGSSHSLGEMGAWGLPSWLSGKEFFCQRRRYRFDPWVRKIPWRRKWQPPLVFLPLKCCGQRSLVNYSPWGRKSVGYSRSTEHEGCLFQGWVTLEIWKMVSDLPEAVELIS